jgi:uncharacterized protein (DUF427 family)
MGDKLDRIVHTPSSVTPNMTERHRMSTTRPATSKTRGRVRIEPGLKRVRAYLGGELVADTTSPMLVWEVPYYPTYYFPLADVRAELHESDEGGIAHSPSRGDARTFTVRAGGREAPHAALRYEDSPIEELRDLVRLDWDSMDGWFEEDEQVFTHPRNPYTRRRHPPQLPARARGGRRDDGRRVDQSHAPVRDRPCRFATTCPRHTCGWTC